MATPSSRGRGSDDVDWLLDARRDDAIQAAVQQVGDHLLRHGSDDSRVPDALEVVGAALKTATHGHDGALGLHLDWTRVHPRLSAVPLPAGEAPHGPGVRLVRPTERSRLFDGREGPLVGLEVARAVAGDFDPDVVSIADLEPFKDGVAAATVAIAAATEQHPVASPDQVAAAAGALLADAVSVSEPCSGAQDAADMFVRLYAALGGSSSAVLVQDTRIELVAERSPFGRAVCQIPSLSRVAEAIAGRLAARVAGSATVVHTESIAHGDPFDRFQVFLGEVDEEIAGSVYTWPPTGTHDQADPPPRLEMTVSLPRQSHSVPVIRRLSAHILRAFGVAADSIHDVELAISEACANVIRHAVDSEVYEVSVELAADRCAITVVDRGEGFDAAGIGEQDDDDAESGRGLSLMRALVDNLNFVSEPKVGAVVHMVKRLDYDSSHPFRHTGA